MVLVVKQGEGSGRDGSRSGGRRGIGGGVLRKVVVVVVVTVEGVVAVMELVVSFSSSRRMGQN